MGNPNSVPMRETLSHRDITDLKETAIELAEAARAAILTHFRAEELATDNKDLAGFDPVTAADRAAERAMREILARRRPQDAIFGEEFGAQDGSSGLTWVLDPIDGTRAFLIGAPTWGVLIAIADEAGPFFGVIDQPYTAERWVGGLGDATLRAPGATRRLQTRETVDLATARLCSTFPEVGTPLERDAFQRVAQEVQLVRFGLDCYAYGLLAAGQIDLVIEAGLQAYDICAPIAVIEAAGGIVTTWDGGNARQGGRVLAAANRELHGAAIALLTP